MEHSEHIASLIYHRIVGDLSAEGQKELDAWVAEDEQHRSTYERLLNQDYLKQQYARRQAINPQRAMKAMQAQIDSNKLVELKPQTHRTRNIGMALVGAAAAVALFFGIRQLVFTDSTTDPQAQVAVITAADITPGSTQAILTTDKGDTIRLGSDAKLNAKLLAQVEGSEEIHVNSLSTPRGGEFKVTLEDGTEVWLNAESRLKYPETFGDGDRRVTVEGEAYFKVAKDEDHPFYVETSGQQVRVVGTEFNIHSYQEDAQVATTLVTGSIALRPAQGNGSELMLTPGHQALFDKQTQAANVKAADTEVVTSWRHGKFVFENQTLEQIMTSLSRWYDFEFEFRNKELAKTVFGGSVSRQENFAEVLHVLEASGGIKFRQKGRTIIISNK